MVGSSLPLVLRVLRAEQGYRGRVSLRVASSALAVALKDSQVLQVSWLISHR